MDWEAKKKQYWARLFYMCELHDPKNYKALALRVNDKICKLLGLWTIYDATVEQLDQAYGFTNDLEGNKLIVKKKK